MIELHWLTIAGVLLAVAGGCFACWSFGIARGLRLAQEQADAGMMAPMEYVMPPIPEGGFRWD